MFSDSVSSLPAELDVSFEADDLTDLSLDVGAGNQGMGSHESVLRERFHSNLPPTIDDSSLNVVQHFCFPCRGELTNQDLILALQMAHADEGSELTFPGFLGSISRVVAGIAR